MSLLLRLAPTRCGPLQERGTKFRIEEKRTGRFSAHVMHRACRNIKLCSHSAWGIAATKQIEVVRNGICRMSTAVNRHRKSLLFLPASLNVSSVCVAVINYGKEYIRHSFAKDIYSRYDVRSLR